MTAREGSIAPIHYRAERDSGLPHGGIHSLLPRDRRRTIPHGGHTRIAARLHCVTRRR